MISRVAHLIVIAAMVSACGDSFEPDYVHHFSDVATGGDHSCAVTTAGQAFCWGRGDDGELGTGDVANEFLPRAVQSDVVFKSITAGFAHTCALDQNGRAYCWGFNAYNQLGTASTANARIPVPVASEERFAQISAGAYHTCAVTLDARVFCWGYNLWGQTGTASTQPTLSPQQVAGNLRASAVSAGDNHTCALSANGAIFCWGSNQYSQLGVGLDTLYSSTPVQVHTNVHFAKIDAGATHTCGISTTLAAYCWGTDWHGELGDGVIFINGLAGPSTPSSVELLGHVTVISAGVNQTCALDQNGAYCWGRGTDGQNGNAALNDFAVRQPMKGIRSLNFSVLATGGNTHACGIVAQFVYCWGTGPFGQLGAGAIRSSLLPQRIGR